MCRDAFSNIHYAAGEHQKDAIVIEVRERKWWRNDLEVGPISLHFCVDYVTFICHGLSTSCS